MHERTCSPPPCLHVPSCYFVLPSTLPPVNTMPYNALLAAGITHRVDRARVRLLARCSPHAPTYTAIMCNAVSRHVCNGVGGCAKCIAWHCVAGLRSGRPPKTKEALCIMPLSFVAHQRDAPDTCYLTTHLLPICSCCLAPHVQPPILRPVAPPCCCLLLLLIHTGGRSLPVNTHPP